MTHLADVCGAAAGSVSVASQDLPPQMGSDSWHGHA
jgi:hypothetical protein